MVLLPTLIFSGRLRGLTFLTAFLRLSANSDSSLNEQLGSSAKIWFLLSRASFEVVFIFLQLRYWPNGVETLFLLSGFKAIVKGQVLVMRNHEFVNYSEGLLTCFALA